MDSSDPHGEHGTTEPLLESHFITDVEDSPFSMATPEVSGVPELLGR